jgi:hypothetical protein
MEAPRSPLAGRYRYLTTVDTGGPSPRWLAVDQDTDRRVLAAVVDAGEASRWELLKGAEHLHLAAVLEVVAGAPSDAIPGGTPPAPSVVVVSEFVAGRTLQGHLQKGQIHPFKAVAWVLRLIDAITLVHERGGVVGTLSPRSIVVEPTGRAIAPVLATNVAPPLASYCSPERLAGAGPSADDDVWALHASLYAALTGEPPFAGAPDTLLHRVRTGKPRPLSDFGVSEPLLQLVLERGLRADERLRTTELAALTEALDAWERGREPEEPRPKPPRLARKVVPGKLLEPLLFDLDSLPDVSAIEFPEEPAVREEPAEPVPAANSLAEAGIDATAPVIPAAPPLPALAAPRPVSSGSRGRLGLFIGLGVLLLIAVAVVAAVVVVGGREPEPPPTPVATPSPSATESSAAPAEVTPTQQRAACIASYFETDVRARERDLDFVCSNDDYREISARLFSLARPERTEAAEATPNGPKDATGIVVTSDTDPYDLAWFELTGTAIVRTTCCADAKPIELPSTKGWCQQLQGQVRSLADASRKPIDLSSYGRKFEDAVQCLYSTGTKRPYDYEKPPSEQQQKNFQRFLKYAAESDAKRSKMRWLH